MSAFGSGPSNGQFWFGQYGFLYKKNVGVGGRRSTKMNPGGNITCNSPTYLYNKYKPGGGGIGASSTSNRRAKNRLATVCGPNQCFPCYTTLGQYSNYTHNPNGFIPCYTQKQCVSNLLVPGDAPANMDTRGLTKLTSLDNTCPSTSPGFFPSGLNFYFNGLNGLQIGWINQVIVLSVTQFDLIAGFTLGAMFGSYPNTRRNMQFWYSGTLTNGSTKYIRLVYYGQNLCNDDGPVEYEIIIAIDSCFQYIEIRTHIVPTDIGIWNIIIPPSSLLNTCGDFDTTAGGPQPDGSYVFRSDLQGNNWQFFRNSHLNHL